MERNVSGQKLDVLCFDYSTGAPKTGDAANLTAYVSIDDGTLTALNDTSASEISSTNAPGWYRFDLTQAETNGIKLFFSGKSSTSNVVMMAGGDIYTTPANFSLAALSSAGGVTLADGVSHGGTLGSSTATLALSRLNVTSQTSNTSAVTATGNGTGHGFNIGSGSGATGNAVTLTANSTNGNGLAATGSGTGSGELVTGGATGHGVNYVGGATSGNGLRATGTAGNSAAMNLIGQGSAAGLLSTGGATGHGVSAVGGATSGSGISAVASTSGSGLVATGVGTTQPGIAATGGSTSSAGISATGGGTGAGILATSGSGATGNGITATAVSTNGHGVSFAGVGTGSGMLLTKGASGNGLATDTISASSTTTLSGAVSFGSTFSTTGTTTFNAFTVTNATTLTGAVTASNASNNITGIDVVKIRGTTSAGTAGYVGIDWSAINAPTTSVNLSGTTISSSQAVASVSGDVGSVTGNVGGNVTGSVGSVATGGITRASLAADTGLQPIRSNTAQAGASTSITLDASASAVASFYVNDLILITGGTGVGQARYITAYNETTKVATVPAWYTNPDNTSTFAIIGADSIPGATAPTAAQVATAVWQDTTSGDFTVSGSIGKSLFTSGVVPGGSGGLMISGTNSGTTTLGALTVSGATTLTGAVTATNGSNAISGIDVAKINAVSTSSVTTVSANVGTTQPVNFTGTAGSALVKSDTVDIAGAAVSTSSAQIGVNVVNAGGTAWASGAITRAALAADTGLQPIRSNTAQAGASTSVTLDASASAVDDFYNNCMVYTTGGTGVGQAREILDYVGSTKVATVRAWATNPDNTTTFAILPEFSVWDDITASHLTSGSTGSSLNAAGSAGDPWSTSLPGAYGAGTAGYIVGTNLDTTVSSRLAPTVASRTLDVTATGGAGIDWGNVENQSTTVNLSNTTVATVTTVTNQLTAAQIATGVWQDATAGDFTVASSIGKSLYTGNVVPGASGGHFIAGTNAATTITTALTTTFTGNLTGSVASVVGNVGGNVTGSVGSLAAGAQTNVADAVWNAVQASYVTVGTTGKSLSNASSAGDPWVTSLPGSYTTGQAGYILGTNLDALVSSRLAPTVSGRTLDVTATGGAGIDWSNVESASSSVTLSGTTVGTATALTNLPSIPNNWLTAAGIASGALVAAVWDGSVTGHTTAGTFGGSLANASSAGDPWSTPIPGTYTAGQAGYILSQIDTNSSDAATDSAASLAILQTAGFSITVAGTVPSDGGLITLYRGDDYLSADGRALIVNVTGAPNITGGTLLWKVFRHPNVSGQTILEVTGTITYVASGQYTLTVELTSDDTDGMPTGYSNECSWVVTDAAGHVMTLVEGQVQFVN